MMDNENISKLSAVLIAYAFDRMAKRRLTPSEVVHIKKESLKIINDPESTEGSLKLYDLYEKLNNDRIPYSNN